MSTPPSFLGSEQGFTHELTRSLGTAFAEPPTADEERAIAAARQELTAHRTAADAQFADEERYIQYSLEVFRTPLFAPLHFSDWVVEQVLAEFGEPPVVERDDDPAFSEYLRQAVLWVATSRVRRHLAEQARRTLPALVTRGHMGAALAVERNAYFTVMSDAATPLLVQMMVAALARWYEAHEPETE
jgi:hypothetical protein